MADQKLLDGVRLFRKKDTAPDFVLASGVITPNKLYEFCKANPELMSEYNGEKQIRIQVLKSKDGNPYIAVDSWKPESKLPDAVQTPSNYVPPTEAEQEQLPF